MVGSSSYSVFLFPGWRFVLGRLGRWTWLLNTYMSMPRITKVETHMYSCMAILHSQVEGSLALIGPDLDHFLYTGEEESLLRLVKWDFRHRRSDLEPFFNLN